MAQVKAKLFRTQRQTPKIDRYAVLEVLGQGGMGTVYSVYDDTLDRRVALKFINGPDSEDARTRMLREAQAMAQLNHPNVVPVFDFGEHDGCLFLVMEYVEGATLRQWQDAAPRDWTEVLDKYIQAGRGLEAAHARGLVHRDFKPHNAVVGSDDRVRVLDFGLAVKPASDEEPLAGSTARPSSSDWSLETPLTATGAVLGTPAYMSPEQLDGLDVDHRTDQYSFCVALWEALHGERPHSVSTTLTSAPAPREPSDASALVDYPAAVKTALMRGLDPSAEKRWSDMGALLAKLESIRSRGRRRTVAAAAGLVFVGAVGLPIAFDLRDSGCANGAKRWASVWGPDRRQRIRTSFGK